VDVGAETRERLVDRVVDDFVHEVVQAVDVRVADVHARALANGFEAFENGDRGRAVLGRRSALAGRVELVVHRSGKPSSPINFRGFLRAESMCFEWRKSL